jgi:HD-like signal output (HDOD) protein
MVAHVGALPSVPATLTSLDRALSDEDCSLGQVADIMSADVGMVAKVLQLVNSSFFGLRTEIHDLRHALAYLGVETLRDFAMAGAAVRVFKPSEIITDGWLATFNAHSMAVADTASQLVRTSVAQCEASIAGMLHSIGELVVAERAPEKLLAISTDVSAGCSPDAAETRHIGTTYPVVGGYLLSQWGMGYNVIEAITCQREVWTGPPRGPALGDVIRMADYLVGSREAARHQDAAEASGTAGPGSGLGGDVKSAGVCQTSTQIECDEDYQERVGMLRAVQLYNDGILRL